jgi:hypothetical protein
MGTDYPLRDGWNEMPCGGAVRVKDGVPLEVSDQGRWNLDEAQILAEAAKLTGCKINWYNLDRWRRWRGPGPLSVFSEGNRYRWSVAKVALEPCEECGSAAGETWVQRGDEAAWLCRACAGKAASGVSAT